MQESYVLREGAGGEFCGLLITDYRILITDIAPSKFLRNFSPLFSLKSRGLVFSIHTTDLPITDY